MGNGWTEVCRPAMEMVRLLCQLLCAFALMEVAQADCSALNDCKDMTGYSFYKYANSKFASDDVTGTCCTSEAVKGDVNPFNPAISPTNPDVDKPTCYSEDFGKCQKTEEYWGSYTQVDHKSYQKNCGMATYNTFTHKCMTRKAGNKDANYKFWYAAPQTLSGAAGFRIVGIPFMGILFTLIALVVTVIMVKDAIGSLGLGGKVVLLCCIMSMFLSIFLFFGDNSSWQYGVVLIATSALTICSLSAAAPVFAWVVIGVHLFVFLYVVGGVVQGSFTLGNGLFTTVAPTNGSPTFDGCTDPYYSSHFAVIPGSAFAPNAGSDAQWPNVNPEIKTWGYCSRGWMAFMTFVAIIQMGLISFITVGHMAVMFGPSGGGGGGGGSSSGPTEKDPLQDGFLGGNKQ